MRGKEKSVDFDWHLVLFSSGLVCAVRLYLFIFQRYIAKVFGLHINPCIVLGIWCCRLGRFWLIAGAVRSLIRSGQIKVSFLALLLTEIVEKENQDAESKTNQHQEMNWVTRQEFVPSFSYHDLLGTLLISSPRDIFYSIKEETLVLGRKVRAVCRILLHLNCVQEQFFAVANTVFDLGWVCGLA